MDVHPPKNCIFIGIDPYPYYSPCGWSNPSAPGEESGSQPQALRVDATDLPAEDLGSSPSKNWGLIHDLPSGKLT